MAHLSSYLERIGARRIADAVNPMASEGRPPREVSDWLAAQTDLPVSPDLQENEAVLATLFGDSADVVLRRVQVGEPPLEALLAYVDNLVDRKVLTECLAGLLFRWSHPAASSGSVPNDLAQAIAQTGLSLPSVQVQRTLNQAVSAMADGNAVLLLAGTDRFVRLGTPEWDQRQVAEPSSESVVRGPREGFVESISTNLALLRRRLRTARLHIEDLHLGTVTRTRVAIAYVAGVARPELVAEVRRRIGRIRIDGILESGYIEEFIQDTPWTIFPLLKHSERPDVVAADLLEGRVAIFTDGTPFVLLAPTVFPDLIHAPEDYYGRSPASSAIRLLRWLYVALALLGPSLYIALTTFHQEMLPTSLLLAFLNARESIPFPALIEALLMETAFEALREAGVRLPRQVGQAVSIVGALVIGEAAVRAGIVSNPMVIVVSLTGIASFLIPRFNAAMAIRILRFPMMLLAGTFGALGIFLGFMAILIHLARLRSFGVPYLAPLAPVIPGDLKDAVFRLPWWQMARRPRSIPVQDQQRQAAARPPHPPGG